MAVACVYKIFTCCCLPHLVEPKSYMSHCINGLGSSTTGVLLSAHLEQLLVLLNTQEYNCTDDLLDHSGYVCKMDLLHLLELHATHLYGLRLKAMPLSPGHILGADMFAGSHAASRRVYILGYTTILFLSCALASTSVFSINFQTLFAFNTCRT
jgi:hypothetical protein